MKSKERFWNNKEYLQKLKEVDVDFYNIIKNGKDFQLDLETFSLKIDGIDYKLKFGGL